MNSLPNIALLIPTLRFIYGAREGSNMAYLHSHLLLSQKLRLEQITNHTLDQDRAKMSMIYGGNGV